MQPLAFVTVSRNKKLFLLPLVFFACHSIFAQTSCVDYDKTRYPISVNGIQYQWNPIWNFTNMKEKKRTPINISNFMFKGLLEYTPAGYNPNDQTKKYPVIIYFHGISARGSGTPDHLCRLFRDLGDDLAGHLSLPGRIELDKATLTVTDHGQQYSYIVISPQYSVYLYPKNPGDPSTFPSAQAVEDVINYVVANYRVDPNRIYLTGMSGGANMITEYAGSSVARAQRVAAIVPIGLCSDVNSHTNIEGNIKPENIANGALPTWFVSCSIDNACPINIPQAWINGINNNISGKVVPRFTFLNDANPNPLYQCSDTLWHDAWSRLFDPNFKGIDGVNKNIYEWFIQFSRSGVLPVKLKNFNASLLNDRVYLKWETSNETHNASFIIEKAGVDQHFITLCTAGGAANNSGDKVYEFVDDHPFSGLSYYRLVQLDADGTKHYFETKRIINHVGASQLLVISPNPFKDGVTAFVHVDRSQKVSVYLTDITGKKLAVSGSTYPRGTTEVSLKAGHLAKGVYLIRAEGENFSETRKIIKQ